MKKFKVSFEGYDSAMEFVDSSRVITAKNEQEARYICDLCDLLEAEVLISVTVTEVVKI